MNNDIKEIIEYLKNENNYDEFDCSGEAYIQIKQDKTNQLLSYITNLQKKLDFMTDRNNEKQDRIDKAIEILKDTSVDMPETLLIETIDYAINILNGGDEE